MKFDPRLYNRQKLYECKKCGTIQCPNSYVTKACYMLDGDQQVLRFQFQAVRYRFFHPIEGCTRTNFIDFLVETKSGRKLVQTLPAAYQRQQIMIARIEGMMLRAHELKLPLEIWTEEKLFGTNELYRKSIIMMLC
jgi:hypothetical protein